MYSLLQKACDNESFRICLFIECLEYSNLTREVSISSGFSIDSIPQEIGRHKCQSSSGFIVGGVKAMPQEFPHMAAIGFKTLDNQISFKCGGSLISHQFVLTAAHCSSTLGVKPSIVRLGYVNLYRRDKDMMQIDVNIENFIKHKAYNRATKQNDIALIKLKGGVAFEYFATFIRPACLYQSENFDDLNVIATGSFIIL